MSDPTPASESASSVVRPEGWAGKKVVLPASAREVPGTEVSVVALIDAAEHVGWAADAALKIASAWGDSGRRVVLADLHLDEPVLHERAGQPNLEGVTDIFLYGASLARSAREVENEDFYLISGGTFTSDSGEVLLRHERWPRLVEGFRGADALLLLFLPAGVPHRDAVLHWADEAVLLTEHSAADDLQATLPGELPVRACLVPSLPGSEPGPAAVARADGENSPVIGVEPTEHAVSEEPAAARAAGPGAAAAAEPPRQAGDGATITTDAGRRRRRGGGGGIGWLGWLFIIIALLIVAALVLGLARPDLLAPLGIGAVVGWGASGGAGTAVG